MFSLYRESWFRNILSLPFSVLNSSDIAPISRIPTNLYSLTFPDHSGEAPIKYRLGEPITIQFTAVAGFITLRDWVGLYPTTANPNSLLTTTKSEGRWLFVTGSVNRDWEPEGESHGKTIVKSVDGKTLMGVTEVTTFEADGHDCFRGKLTFRNNRLPWRAGIYEARYHYDGKHGVITGSQSFEIVADEFSWEHMDDAEAQLTRVTATLHTIVERCLDIDIVRGDERLQLNEDILAKVKVGEECPDAGRQRYSNEGAT